jgi:aldose 1-epimerase
MAMTGSWYEIAAGDYRAHISEVGAGLAGLRRGERAITPAWDPALLPPMACGAIRAGRYSFAGKDFQLPLAEPPINAIHGLVRWARWELADQDASSVTLAVDQVPQTGYPFELSYTMRYALAADSGLTVSVTARNSGEQNAPFGAGFHPYLDFDGHDLDHLEVDIPAVTMLLTDDHQIPTQRSPVADTPYQLSPRRPLGSLRLDHGFTDLFGSKATVSIGDEATEIWWSDEFEYLQVFTPPPEKFGRAALAIEPMTCPANAFNSGDSLITLVPGQVWSASWGIAAS